MSTRDNRSEPVLVLLHSSIRRFDDGAFKSECPVCEGGILPVHRHHKTYAVSALDSCGLCGQRVVYVDEKIGGEDVVRDAVGEGELLRAMASARKALTDGLTYYEHDGHRLPKRVVRDALVALGVPEESQP